MKIVCKFVYNLRELFLHMVHYITSHYNRYATDFPEICFCWFSNKTNILPCSEVTLIVSQWIWYAYIFRKSKSYKNVRFSLYYMKLSYWNWTENLFIIFIILRNQGIIHLLKIQEFISRFCFFLERKRKMYYNIVSHVFINYQKYMFIVKYSLFSTCLKLKY